MSVFEGEKLAHCGVVEASSAEVGMCYYLCGLQYAFLQPKRRIAECDPETLSSGYLCVAERHGHQPTLRGH
jgi:hypothetical protein